MNAWFSARVSSFMMVSKPLFLRSLSSFGIGHVFRCASTMILLILLSSVMECSRTSYSRPSMSSFRRSISSCPAIFRSVFRLTHSTSCSSKISPQKYSGWSLLSDARALYFGEWRMFFPSCVDSAYGRILTFVGC